MRIRYRMGYHCYVAEITKVKEASISKIHVTLTDGKKLNITVDNSSAVAHELLTKGYCDVSSYSAHKL